MSKFFSVCFLLVCFLLSPVYAADSEMWTYSSDMTKFLAKHYKVDPIIIVSMAQNMRYDDDVSTAIYLAKRADTNPMFLYDERVEGKSWQSIMKSRGISAESLFGGLVISGSVPQPFRHAYSQYNMKQKNKNYQMVLYDNDVRNMVQLRLMKEAFGKNPQNIMAGVAAGRSFTQMIMNQLEQ